MTTDPGDRPSRVRPFLGQQWTRDPQPPPPGQRDDVERPVRPFLVTAGRTAAVPDLALETQVVLTAEGTRSHGGLTFEYLDIVTLCEQPLAVAELAARLHLHVGVVRVLVDDLRRQGIVATVEPDEKLPDDIETILRVIHGLRQRH